MGLFRNLKQTFKAVSEMSAEIQAAMPATDGSTTFGAGQSIETVILDPTSQADVDRLLAGGGSVRAVVLGSYDDMSAGDRPVRTRVTVRLRPRLQGGGLGDEQTLEVWVGWKVASLMEPGLEIPVEMDRSSGRVTSIVAKELTQELSPRFGEAKKRHPAITTGLDLDGITQAPALLKELLTPSKPPPAPAGMPITDPLMAPINGVTWPQYIAVRAHIGVHSLTSGFDEAAESLGVPAAQWPDAHSGWMARISSAPQLAAQWGWDLDRAQRDLRGDP